MSQPSARVLIVEDEVIVALDIEQRLRRLGYEVAATVHSAAEALARAAALRPDVVLMDIQLGRGPVDGIDAAIELRARLGVAVVFLTAYSDPPTIERAKAASPHGYLLKPFDENALRTTIDLALHRDRLDRALRRSHEDLGAALDAQGAAVLLLDDAERVCFANTAALQLTGGTAAGGERHWAEMLPLAAGDRAAVAAMARVPRAQRRRTTATLRRPNGAAAVIEIDVADDPRDPSRRVLFLYDVTELHELRRLIAERGRSHALVGESAAMRRVSQLIGEVARVDATVLVVGETGTGKELVARAIHRESARRDGPFLAVNCGGLNEELAASQLFGHCRGAFTGAVSDTPGVFEACAGGTLLLDELGDLPPRIQTALLRVLEERRVTRVGESRSRSVDVRIVAATNRDLAADVAQGRFRADLLYRIRVGRIVLPPLRDRRDDLWPLVQHALGEIQAVGGRAVTTLTEDAMRAVMAYAWPGNVRELKNALGYAAMHCRGSEIDVEDLPPEIVGESAPVAADDLPGDERERIVAALARTGGERKAAAALLGIGRATLYRKLAQYGLG
jgi:DNA-binding NtrC family response regulator